MLKNLYLGALSMFLICGVFTTAISGQKSFVYAQEKPSQENEKTPYVLRIMFFRGVDINTVSNLISVIETYNTPERIEIYMSSFGGNPEAALVAYNYLTSLPIEVHTYNLGHIASAATVIFCAGDKRYASPRSSFLFHELKVSFSGEDRTENYGRYLDYYDLQKKRTNSAIKQCSQFSDSELNVMYTDGKVLSAENAKTSGYVTGITNTMPTSQARLVYIVGDQLKDGFPPFR
ncbi:peptidase S14 ClpP [Crinalium epipsammum PCC 9333]|uniref:Peptidase S14 ClpP n=1 Tax=Crinalium epipsammum PCC 9333 TaxID=1173022 RepID=K9VVV6_9CYAN|nr:ATP-dependent Clp protease proteolytic subunit [Crinalium epipsammum]AFZ11310.1 peptidase S14 ClpP [Crinalium epipsammum PCC 9333]